MRKKAVLTVQFYTMSFRIPDISTTVILLTMIYLLRQFVYAILTTVILPTMLICLLH